VVRRSLTRAEGNEAIALTPTHAYLAGPSGVITRPMY
jgi:hypothetical protein